MPTKRPIQDEPENMLMDEKKVRATLEEYNARAAHPINFSFSEGTLHLGQGQKEIILPSNLMIAFDGNIETHARVWTEKKEGANHAPIISGQNITFNDTAHGLGSERLIVQATGSVNLQNKNYMGAVAQLLVHDIDISASIISIDRVNVRNAKLNAPIVETVAEAKDKIDIRPSFSNVELGQEGGKVSLIGTCHDCKINASNGHVYQADYSTRVQAPAGFNCGFDPHQQQSHQRQVLTAGRSVGQSRP